MNNVERILVGGQAMAHIQAYIDYRNIVGDTDGGKLLSEAEYEEYKKRALEAREHRVYVSWRNINSNIECRLIGPSSMCFCTHRYRDHATDSKDKKIHCRMKNCPCAQFDYIPVRGAQDIKCHCKHSYNKHDLRHPTRACTLSAKCKCPGFVSSFGCSCGDDYGMHATVFETKEERIAAGLPVDNLGDGGQGYAALGGITNFSSLIDGVDRVAPGGAGAAPRIAGPGPTGPHIEEITDEVLARAPPPKKLSENEELALYAQKYDKPEASTAAQRRSNWAPRQKQSVATAGPSPSPPAADVHLSEVKGPAPSPAPAADHAEKKNPLTLLKKKHESLRKSGGPITPVQPQAVSAVEPESDSLRAAVFLEDCKIAELEAQLADTSLSQAKKYALKKEIAKHKATRLQEQRRRSANIDPSDASSFADPS